MAPPSKLPVLPLTYPLIILPGSRITIPITHETATALFALIDSSGGLADDNDEDGTRAMIAAVPITSNDQNAELSEFGCCCRILKLIRPASRSQPRQPYLLSLSALTRISMATVPSAAALLPRVEVKYPDTDISEPSPDDLEAFKRAAVYAHLRGLT